MPTSPLTLREFFAATYQPRKLATAAASTLLKYEWELRHFTRFLGREPLVADLTDATIGSFLASRLAQGVSPSTANKGYSVLTAMGRYAALRRLLDEPPELKPLKELRRAPTAWTTPELARLLAAARTMRRAIWWKALLRLAVDSGLRKEALLALTWDNVDLVAGSVLALAEYSKTDQDELIAIGPESVVALERLRAAGLDPVTVFPDSRHWTRYYQEFKELLARAGLPAGRRNKTQRLRRTSGTLAELVGGPGAGSKHLGHSNPAITARHYLDRTQLPGNDFARRFPRVLGPEVGGFQGCATLLVSR